MLDKNYTVETRIHPDLPNYLIYEDGRIYSFHSKKFLKPSLNKYGYHKVVLFKNNIRHYLTVHRVVGITFISNPENKEQINHKDGNKINNHKDNLEWMTNNENLEHALKTGLKKIFPKGSEIYNAKFSNDEVKFIRRLWSLNMSQKEIGDLIGFSHKLIHKIVNNKSYTNVK